jgi:8-oxo-dGTP diphosphatase
MSALTTTPNPTPNVRVGVAVFIIESSAQSTTNSRFLVGKRLGSHGAGSFALPGGHLEFGETPEECVTRELMEETGLIVTNVKFLTATNDYMPKDGKHYVTLFMVCVREEEKDEPQVLEPDKCEGWEWISWAQLKGWIEVETSAREGEVLERRVFTPLLSLMLQRPGVVPRVD